MITLELDQRGVAQTGHAVAGLVVGVVAREDAELGARLGEEQDDDAVEVSGGSDGSDRESRPSSTRPSVGTGCRATTALARSSTLRRIPWRSSFDTPADSVFARSSSP